MTSIFKRIKNLGLVSILLVAGYLHLHSLLTMDLHIWDGSVYAGMGKWFFSLGEIGLFEVFRPILLPLLEGLFWFMGLDPMFWGGIVGIVASLLLMILVYRVGEEASPGYGIIASAMLGFSPIFLTYGHVPMSDVISTVFVFYGLCLLLRGKYFYSGVFSALGFLTRFPQGLSLVIIAVYIVLEHFYYSHKEEWPVLFRKAFSVLSGFILPVTPYFVWSAYMFGNPLVPIQEGSAIVLLYAHIYAKGAWFYFIQLGRHDIFFYLSFGGFLFVLYESLQKIIPRKEILLTMIAFLVYFIYFTSQPHKDLRFAIPFLPYMAVLGSYALMKVLHPFKPKPIHVYGLTVGIVALLSTFYMRTNEKVFSPIRTNYYSYFDEAPYGTTLMATEPMAVAEGATKLTAPVYETWQGALDEYNREFGRFQYVSLDSCVLELGCSVDYRCLAGKSELLERVRTDGDLVFSGQENACTLLIYKIR